MAFQEAPEFRLIQCYHCLDFHHKSSNCPNIDNPPICSYCANTGHQSKDCKSSPRPPRCHQCLLTGHPATAVVCRVYKHQYKEVMNKLEDFFIRKYLASQPASTNLQQEQNFMSAMNTSILTSESPSEFLTSLFTSLKKAAQDTDQNTPASHPSDQDTDLVDTATHHPSVQDTDLT